MGRRCAWARSAAAAGRRRLGSSPYPWPMYEKIIRTPGNENTAEKARKALAEIDRILDIMEPGTLALSFNGGKDACAMMHLVREACEHHRTHKFTHVQPIWFKNPTDEFPELVHFVKQQADLYFTHPSQVRRVWRGAHAPLHPREAGTRTRRRTEMRACVQVCMRCAAARMAMCVYACKHACIHT